MDIKGGITGSWNPKSTHTIHTLLFYSKHVGGLYVQPSKIFFKKIFHNIYVIYVGLLVFIMIYVKHIYDNFIIMIN